MWNHIKTALLLGGLSGVVLFAGYAMGGQLGLTIALVLAVLLNFGAFFYSHKMILSMYKARPASKKDYPELNEMVESLAKKMGLPKPKVYIIPTETPNAFATGPSPKKAVVACTEGILKILDDDELRGVVAHELGHIKNRDMLITTIAATMAAVISYLAQMAQFAAIFGGMRDDEGGGSLLGMLVMAILAPIIAVILQLAISRSREFLADAAGARAVGDGHALANALEKLEKGVHAHPMKKGNSTTSSLFIVNPFKADALRSMFSTHPSTKQRVQRLRNMSL